MVPMNVWLDGFSFLLGAILGSFMNVLVMRLPSKQSVIFPGSHCPQCQHSIRWRDKIPLLSYLLLRGKCRDCHKTISIRYWVIEFLTAVLFVAALRRFGWSWGLVLRDWPFLALMVAVAFIDLEHRMIPDVCSLGGLLLGLSTAWLGIAGSDSGPVFDELQSVAGAVLGFGVFFSLEWVYEKLTGRIGLGGGDIKFLAMIGSFEGPSGVLATMWVSSVFGSVVGILIALLNREEKAILKQAIPFGPFLVIGAMYYYLFGDFLWLPFITPT